MSLVTISRSLGRLTGIIIQPSCCQVYKNISRRVLSTPSKWHGLWEPDDLKLEPDIPEYQVLYIQMRGYDFPVLEAYAKSVHGAARNIFNLETDAFASPARSTQVRTFHPHSTNVNQKYDLHKYERIVAADNVPTTMVPILLQFLQKNCPQGIEVSLKEPDPEEEEYRYVPDYDILELQTQKEAIQLGKSKKK